MALIVDIANRLQESSSGIVGEIKKLRRSMDALGRDPLTGRPWSDAYLDWYGDEWGEAEDGILDNILDDLIREKELELGREINDAERDILFNVAYRKKEEYIRKETRLRYYPEMVELHDVMEKVLSLYDVLSMQK